MPSTFHAITARKADLAQPHAPRVCFALHKHRIPFSQEEKQRSMKFRRIARLTTLSQSYRTMRRD
jgi:hypothetical protein